MVAKVLAEGSVSWRHRLHVAYTARFRTRRTIRSRMIYTHVREVYGVSFRSFFVKMSYYGWDELARSGDWPFRNTSIRMVSYRS